MTSNPVKLENIGSFLPVGRHTSFKEMLWPVQYVLAIGQATISRFQINSNTFIEFYVVISLLHLTKMQANQLKHNWAESHFGFSNPLLSALYVQFLQIINPENRIIRNTY